MSHVPANRRRFAARVSRNHDHDRLAHLGRTLRLAVGWGGCTGSTWLWDVYHWQADCVVVDSAGACALFLLRYSAFPFTWGYHRRYTLTNRRVAILADQMSWHRVLRFVPWPGFRIGFPERWAELDHFDSIEVLVQPGQEWYQAGDLIFRKGPSKLCGWRGQSAGDIQTHLSESQNGLRRCSAGGRGLTIVSDAAAFGAKIIGRRLE